MIDKSKWSDEELIVFEEYGYRCVLCGFQYATTLHHEPPRSLNPNWKDEPWTQFPLCAAHHDAVQDMPREEAQELLLRFEYTFARGAIERIKERVHVTNT